MTTGSPARSVIGVPLGISRAATSRATVASLRICIFRSSTLLRISAAGPSDSVEIGPPSPWRAAFSVCQGSVAHLTRTGNSRTPEKTSSLPERRPAVAPPGLR